MTLLSLFAYAFLSNVAMAVVPHEPVVIWFGGQLGIGVTSAVATAGTVAAAWVDHRLFAPLIDRVSRARPLSTGLIGILRGWFARAPFWVLTLSGLTPLPMWPFKAAAFAHGYPRHRYVGAIGLGRLPRYALLAWLGVAVAIPTWALVLLTAVLIAAPLLSTLRPHPNSHQRGES